MTGLTVRETLSFLERFLPAAPARFLQVGTDEGAIAHALEGRGYAAAAIDDEHLHGAPDQRFDAIFFAGSLHALQPIGRTLERACHLLAPGGMILAEALAFDRVNVHTARWFYDLESVLVAAEVIEPPEAGPAAERRPLARWRLEHAFDPPLASGHDMLAAAREHLELSAVEEAPYLYRHLAARVRNGPHEGPRAERVLEVVFELERRLVRERDLAAAGLRFAGKPLL